MRLTVGLDRCDIIVDIDYYVEQGEPGCSYRDGSHHQVIYDSIFISDIKIIEVHFNISFINSKWLSSHPDWHDWLVNIVEQEIIDDDSVYYNQLLNWNSSD